MSLDKKRKIFFVIVTIVFLILFALVFLPSCLAWADKLTLSGFAIIGIPFSQFLLIASALAMGVLVIILFNIDTKVLIQKSKREQDSQDNQE